jgi:hypothetical protein
MTLPIWPGERFYARQRGRGDDGVVMEEKNVRSWRRFERFLTKVKGAFLRRK